MADLEKYLNMQRAFYEEETAKWSLANKDPIVGQYNAHNAWSDYDNYLFKDFDTTGMVALDYGCGPARNAIKFRDRFAKIDGVDIHPRNLEHARANTAEAGITNSEFFLCDGMSIPLPDNTYDVVFSTICLQHIACYDVRFGIFKDAYRILKPGGHICFQMAYGQKPYITSEYYENAVDATGTNAYHDVRVESPDQLKGDLVDKIGFKDFKFDIRPVGPGDIFENWIFAQAQK